MNNKSLTLQVYQALAYLAEGYGAEKITQSRLKFYSEQLVGELTPDELRASIKNISFKCKFFPSVAEIVEIVRPSVDDQANEIAGEIISCISRYGNYQHKEAEYFLGEKWAVVVASGGWQQLCKIENSEVPIVRAQLRELAKACVRKKVRDIQINNSQIENAPGLKKLNFEVV